MSSVAQYERISALYDPLDLAEFLFKRHIRHRIFDGLSGCVLDVGAGTGRNFQHYPAAAWMVACDGSTGMLAQACRRHSDSPTPVLLTAQNVTQLAFADDSFDAVVATWLFGVVPDSQQRSALAELARICRPNGEIRLVDYTLAENWVRRFLMSAFWAPYQAAVMKCSFRCEPEKHAPWVGLNLREETYLYSDFVRMQTFVHDG